jgi:AraC-like DNA-binding protein
MRQRRDEAQLRRFEWLIAKRHKSVDTALRMADAMGISDINGTSRYRPYAEEAEPRDERSRRSATDLIAAATG